MSLTSFPQKSKSAIRNHWALLIVLTLGVCLSAIFVTAAGAKSNKKNVFRFGFLPAERANEMLPNVEKLGAFLSEKMGTKVEVFVPTSYEPLVEGMRFNHLDAAYMDGGPAWIVYKRSNAHAVLAEVKDGNDYYSADAFVRQDSTLTKLEEIKGKRIAFTSRTGSSGFMMPVGSLIAQGLIPVKESTIAGLEDALKATFASTIEAGGYKQALLALLEKRVDVAFGAHDAPERFLDAAQQKQIRRLHRFGKIPSHTIMLNSHVDNETEKKFVAAMLMLNQPEHQHLLKNIYGVDGLRVVDTQAHLKEFGEMILHIPGVEKTLLGEDDD